MQITEISLEELVHPTQPKYNLKVEYLAHVYYFYKEHTQNSIYLVDSGTQTLSQDYNAFGIYDKGSYFDTQKRNYILYISEEALATQESLAKCVASQIHEGVSSFKFAFIEKEYSDFESRNRDIRLIYSLLNNITILNYNVHLENESTSHIKSANYYDVFPLFEDNFICSNSVNSNLKSANRILTAIEKIGKNFIYFLGTPTKSYINLPAHNYERYYLSIAAYLTCVKGYVFDIPHRLLDTYLDIVGNLSSNTYNYASDYLNFVKEPLDCGLLISNRNLFLCLRDKAKEKKGDYSVELSICAMEYQIESKAIQTKSYCEMLLKLDDIQTYPISRLFSIQDTTWDACCLNIEKLNNLCMCVQKELNAHNINKVVNFSNLLIFKYEETTYIGYIQRISGKLPYIAIPTFVGGRKAHIDLDVTQYTKLYCCNLCPDITKTVESILKQNSALYKKIGLGYPKTARGIIFNNVKITNGFISEIPEVSPEELGIWLKSAEQFRDYKTTIITTRFNTLSAWKAGLLSYYGGPLQFISDRIVIKPQMWR